MQTGPGVLLQGGLATFWQVGDGRARGQRMRWMDTFERTPLMASTLRYSKIQIALHWLVVLLFAFNYIVSDGMGQALRTKLEGGVPDSLVSTLHPPIGIAVLVLTVLRLLARWRLGAPDLPAGNHRLLDLAAHWGHRALYLGLVLIPVTGILAWGVGIGAAGEAHEVVVNLTVLLVLGHAAAALFHQFVLKDGVMDRMRPTSR